MKGEIGMRTLCLNLNQRENPSIAENFLVFSPRVQYRDPGLVFIDIGSTSHFFGGEKGLMKEAAKISQDFFPASQLAIADTPAVAQLFSEEQPLSILNP